MSEDSISSAINVKSNSNVPSLTIVVPVYKVDYSYLRHCLDSLIAQTNQGFEALIIDDGSPDDCGKICDEYAAKRSNFRVIHQENQGLSVVRNNGVKESKADWVAFVDGDDWIQPGTVAFFMDFLAEYQTKADIPDLFCWDSFYHFPGNIINNSFFDCTEGETLEFTQTDKERHIDSVINYKKPPGCHMGFGTCNCKAYNKAFLMNNDIWNKPGLAQAQDGVFNLLVFDKAKRIVYRKVRLYNYRFNWGSVQVRYNPDVHMVFHMLYDELMKFAAVHPDKPEYDAKIKVKMIDNFSKIFYCDLVNRNNHEPLRKRFEKASSIFEQSRFNEIILAANTKGASPKLRLVHFLLKRCLYLPLMIFYKSLIVTRVLRSKFK